MGRCIHETNNQLNEELTFTHSNSHMRNVTSGDGFRVKRRHIVQLRAQPLTPTTTAAKIEQTPGQVVAKQQPEVLQYQHLHTVLGDSFVLFAKQHLGEMDEASLETQWNTIFRPDIPYNDA